MYEKYIEQAMNIFMYVDSFLIADCKGNLQYYHTNREDLNMLDQNAIIGKNIRELYVNLDEENSTIYQVLKTGKPALNVSQFLRTVNGVEVNAITSTLPIIESEKIKGVIDISSYAIEPLNILKNKDRGREKLYQLSDVVSLDTNMIQLKEKIRRVANTNSAVMICGETGTGKELVAQSIHTEGMRRNHRFVSQNCAAIPASLIESVLFGTKKGSFTGAENLPGLFELSDGGTLFLDEINSMDISVHAKLLKAVEEKKITRIGGREPVPIDVKIVTATNVAPEELFRNGTIRQDLLYRLSTVTLEVPPLRERIIDIAPLAKHFIHTFNEEMGRDFIDLTEEAYEILSNYSWPGNVRELRNVIENAFNFGNGRFIKKRICLIIYYRKIRIERIIMRNRSA